MTASDHRARKLLLLSVSAGAGHVRAAAALKAACERWFSDVEVEHLDVMDLVPRLFRKVYAESYIKVVEKYPSLWGYLYNRTDQEKSDSAFSHFRAAIEDLNLQRLAAVLRDMKPDHIICTHFLPAQLLAREIGRERYAGPVWVVVTDFDIHSLWIVPNMTGYFFANEEVSWRAAARGVPADIAHVSGIPIMPQFSDPHDRGACMREFGLDPAKLTILTMAGGVGIGGMDIIVENLLGLKGNLQVVALAGRNETLLQKLTALSGQHPGRVIPMGFTSVIERIMAASDLAITKSGGLTTSECLAMGLPMVVISPIPGQEERNADYLLENGAALKACDTSALIYRVSLVLKDRSILDSLSAKSKFLSKPFAAKDILSAVLTR